MIEVDLVLSGSGTLAPAHLGAVRRLIQHGYLPTRVAGTSGGAIVAAAIAFDMSFEEARQIAVEVLDGGLLDPVPWWRPWEALQRFGVFRFDEVRDQLAKHFPGRLGDSPMHWGAFAVDLEVRAPVFFDSRSPLHAALPVADVVAASASIPVFAQAREIPGVSGLYVDGGAAVNFGMGVWDDVPERRTIGVRFGANGPSFRKPVTNPRDYAAALARVLISNANSTHVSTKRYADVIQIRTAGSGLDFSLTEEQIQMLLDDGARAVEEWRRRGRDDLGSPP